MIKFTLRCSAEHEFESWFGSSDAYEKLIQAGQITCPQCGSGSVEKALMAPAVSTTKGKDVATFTTDSAALSPADAAARMMLEAARSIRKKLETEADYVGKNFAEEARTRHNATDDNATDDNDNATPTKPIWGEASLEDAKDLLEDGITVLPVPKLPEDEN
ncbi:MAG: DUF1178 family protein [Pseudomonadota bacterium]